ncbi:hypothetical protein ACFYO2_41630 [Streptomyces sp. NPDC006602]|uniref:hypothetical protein n=1 Tax=Streptomyces sp. NPDC006602 TaxID=3364751 RepID=UPI0036C8E93E
MKILAASGGSRHAGQDRWQPDGGRLSGGLDANKKTPGRKRGRAVDVWGLVIRVVT